MSVISLERVINTTLLTKISKTSSSASSSAQSALTGSSNDALVGQALYNSLRIGASNFAAGMQLLNGSATFVNLSLDTTERLLDMVGKLETIANKANKGNISATAAKQMRGDFDLIAKNFEKVIDDVSAGEDKLFDLDALQSVLSRAGLDPAKVGELASSLKRFTNPGEPTIGSDGVVVSDGNPVPLDEFKRAIRAAVVDPDDPGDDRSGFFTKVKTELKSIRIKLEGNVKALKETSKLIGDNMSLVRAAGLAFLEVSNEMVGPESAEDIAEQIREKIRTGARSSLKQAHNLEQILIAGQAAIGEAKSSENG